MNPQVEHIYNELFINYPTLDACKDDIRIAFILMKKCYTNNGKLLICGNGGSAADADHIVAELMKGFHELRPIDDRFLTKLKTLYPTDGDNLGQKIQEALPAISLTGHVAFTTAFTNDVSPETVFAQQVYALGLEQDILIAISTSGNSRNIINAIKISRAKGMKSISLTGKTGGEIKKLSDIAICVPDSQTDRIQELHRPVYHALCAMLEAEFFSSTLE